MNSLIHLREWVGEELPTLRMLGSIGAFIVLLIGITYSFHRPAKYSKPPGSVTGTREVGDNAVEVLDEPVMEISQLWIYPIKSLRGCKVKTAILEKAGFKYDRRFMLVKPTLSEMVNMQVSKIPEMCLFHTSIQDETITVSYWSPETESVTHELRIPLEPSVNSLQVLDVEMYSSTLHSYNMGSPYNDWFSERFGFPVILAYWGGNMRPVLGNRPGRPADEIPSPPTLLSTLIRKIPVIGIQLYPDDEMIAFSDVAPYLIVSEESSNNTTARLPHGVDMEICKFRGNIVVRNARKAFDEDFWAEVIFGDNIKLILTANCVRCVSLVVDYETGKSGTGKTKDIYKLLSKDRRVDAGSKWSPVFGRYGFVEKKAAGRELNVGESAIVSARNIERTTFSWPGL